MTGVPSCFDHVHAETWSDWQWQYKNRITGVEGLKTFFPDLPAEQCRCFEEYGRFYNFAMTPYLLATVRTDAQGNPLPECPVWRQFGFMASSEQVDYDADSEQVNWERPEEFPTRLLHHKYKQRAVIRLVDTCFSFCNYCYLTARVIDRHTPQQSLPGAWRQTCAYLRDHPEITDVLISGGDPLINTNSRIRTVLKDLADIPSIRTTRLNTRCLTSNPFRIDRELIEIFRDFRLTCIEVHISHPDEITEIVDEKLALFDQVGYRPLLLWRAPLMRGINDSAETLEALFLKLYERRILPYYLFHYAPYTLGRTPFGLPVRWGVEILQKIRRKIPGPAFPRYTLFHVEGKQDIPLEPDGTDTFRYEHDAQGRPVVRFLNWKDEWVVYPDVPA